MCEPVRLGLLALWLAVVWNVVAVRGEGKTSEPDPCRNAATEPDMLECRRGQLSGAERSLAEAVQRLRENYMSDGKEHVDVLLKSQEAWMKFRDAECRMLTFESKSGSAYETYWTDCLAELTRARLKAIQELLAAP